MAGPRLKTKTQIALLGLFLAAMVVAACGLGFIRIPPLEVFKVLASEILGFSFPAGSIDDLHPHVVWEVRLPRIITASVVGAGLAASGAVFQGILRNPLADPYTLGVSSGAAFGASLALLLGAVFAGPYTVSLMAFAGAVATLFAVIALSSDNGYLAPTNLILSGVIVAAILSAAIGLIKYLADEQVSVIIFWLLGSFVARTWLDAGVTFFVTMAGLLIFMFHARELNLLSLGSKSAQSLGVESGRVRMTLLITASIVSAAGVAVSGIIGFVGLLIPHLMRFVVGPDHRLLIPASALAGAALLLIADTLTRAVLPHEVPIGVLTAVIGGPFFCYVFRRRQLGKKHV